MKIGETYNYVFRVNKDKGLMSLTRNGEKMFEKVGLKILDS